MWNHLLTDCVLQTFNWKGCLTRKTYWQFVMVSYVVFSAAVGCAFAGWPNQALMISLWLGLVLGTLLLGASIRRLHDSGHSGVWCLIAPVTVIGFLPLLWFVAKKSRYVDNPYRKDTRVVSPEQRALALVVGKKPEAQKYFLCA